MTTITRSNVTLAPRPTSKILNPLAGPNVATTLFALKVRMMIATTKLSLV